MRALQHRRAPCAVSGVTRTRWQAARAPPTRSRVPPPPAALCHPALETNAFVRLARELAHHRAPAALVARARARAAAQDERRHARAMRLRAARFGAEGGASRRRLRPRRVPRLADVLVENAVEGCVRETFGARGESVACHPTSNTGSTRRVAARARGLPRGQPVGRGRAIPGVTDRTGPRASQGRIHVA